MKRQKKINNRNNLNNLTLKRYEIHRTESDMEWTTKNIVRMMFGEYATAPAYGSGIYSVIIK